MRAKTVPQGHYLRRDIGQIVILTVEVDGLTERVRMAGRQQVLPRRLVHKTGNPARSSDRHRVDNKVTRAVWRDATAWTGFCRGLGITCSMRALDSRSQELWG